MNKQDLIKWLESKKIDINKGGCLGDDDNQNHNWAIEEVLEWVRKNLDETA